MRRPAFLAFLVLLLLDLAGGVLRWSHPDTFGTGILWDLTGLLDVVRACEEALGSATDIPAACQRLPPYLPLAFPLFAGLAALPSGALAASWIAGAYAPMVAVFAREALAWGRLAVPASRHGGADARHGFARAATAFAAMAAFKGSSLGLLGGQPSILVALLLLAWTELDERARRGGPGAPLARAAGLLALAAAASKPNIALPFFVALALAREWRALASAAAATAALQFAASFAWLGPLDSLRALLGGAAAVEAHPLNSLDLLGASGRVDLAPLLALLGFGEGGRMLVLVAVAAGGLALLWRLAPRLDRRLLLFEVNALFVALLYHRDYDLVLLLLLAQPLLRRHAARFDLAAALAALPFALPLQWLHATGMQAAPQAAFAWNLLGCSMVLGVLGMGLWLLWQDLHAAAVATAQAPGSGALPSTNDPA